MDTVSLNRIENPYRFISPWTCSPSFGSSDYNIPSDALLHSLNNIPICLLHNNSNADRTSGMHTNCKDRANMVLRTEQAHCLSSCNLIPCLGSAETAPSPKSPETDESLPECTTSISLTPANPAEESLLPYSTTLPFVQMNKEVLLHEPVQRMRSRSFGSGLNLRDFSRVISLPSRRSPSPKPGLEGSLRARYHWALVRQFIYCSFAIRGDKRKPWVQLAGHKDSFQTAKEIGTVLKKMCPEELHCLTELMNDPLKPFVPLYLGLVTDGTNRQDYMIMRDLLVGFDHSASVMDCKIGIRTYLEDELTKARKKPELRPDMYQKMVELDPNAPTPEEHAQKAVTKPRYMQWRETLSSSTTLGFRVEGIKKSTGFSSKDFKFTKSRQDVVATLKMFTDSNKDIIQMYISRLRVLKKALLQSPFFAAHEVIGTSLLFIHDKENLAGIWMIDFAKTVPLPADVRVDHVRAWEEGNHEDGYLCGLNNLIDCFEELHRQVDVNCKSI